MSKFSFSHLLSTVLVGATLATSAWVVSPALANDSANKADAVKYRNGEKLRAVQTLVVNATYEPNTFDTSLVDNQEAAVALRPVVDGLVRENAQGQYVGVGATSWDVSPDGKVWTFHLRKEAKWHNGDPVVAGDYVYSWQRLVDPKTGANYGGYLAQANVVGADAAYKGEGPVTGLGVRAVDDYTLEVTLTKPTPWFVQMLTYPTLAPINKRFMDEWGGKLAQAVQQGKFVGNGPYKFVKYTLNESLEFVKNPDYWDADNVALTNVKHVYLRDPNTSYFAYEKGELAFTSLPRALKDKLTAEKPQEVKSAPQAATNYYLFNTEKLNQQERQALQLLVDNKFITKELSKRGVATSIFAPTYLTDGQLQTEAAWFNQERAANVAKAVELLKQAGHSPDNPVVVQYTYPKSPPADLMANAVEGWFKRDGKGLVKFERHVVDGRSFYDELDNGNYNMAPISWGADYNQVSSHLDTLRCGNLNNNARWCDPEYDKLLDLAAAEQDPTRRAEYYAQANKLVQQQAPIAPISWAESLVLVKPYLRGYNLNNNDRYVRDFYLVE